MSVQQKNLPTQLAREPFVQSSPWNSVLHLLTFRGVLYGISTQSTLPRQGQRTSRSLYEE